MRVAEARFLLADALGWRAVDPVRFAEALFEEGPCCRLPFEEDVVVAMRA